MERRIQWYSTNIINAIKIKCICNLVGVVNMGINFLMSIIYVGFIEENAEDRITISIFVWWLISILLFGISLYMVYKCENRIKEWHNKRMKLISKLNAMR